MPGKPSSSRRTRTSGVITPEVLGDDRERPKLRLGCAEERGAGPRRPPSVARRLRPGGDRPVAREAAEVVDPEHVDERQHAPHPVDPPAVARPRHRLPVVERVPPQLAEVVQSVGRRPRDDLVEREEELRVRQVVAAVDRDVDGDVPDDPHAALGRVRPQGAPLALEPHLLLHRAGPRERRPVLDPRVLALPEAVRPPPVRPPRRGSPGARPSSRTPRPTRTASRTRRAGSAAGPATSGLRRRPASRRTRTPPAPRRPPGSDVGWSCTPSDRSSRTPDCLPCAAGACRTDHHLRGHAAGRLRPLACEGVRRRPGGGRGDRRPRRPRDPPGRRPLPPPEGTLARGAARGARQRPLRGLVRGRRGRPLEVRDRGLGRPPRRLARRARPQGRRGPGRPERRARRGGRAVRAGSRRRVATLGRPARRPRPARRGPEHRPRGRRRAGARAGGRLVRAVPALVGRPGGRRTHRPRARRARVRRPLPPADPSDRPDEPQGAQQRRAGRARRRREPVGDRRRGGRPRRDRPGSRHRGRPRGARRRAPGSGHGARARPRAPDVARPPVARGASGVVPAPPGRVSEVRGEPAQALPGHPQPRLGDGRPKGALEGDPRRRPPLVRRRRDRVPRRQPAHEARPVLGVADRRGAQAAPGDRLPLRGLHAPRR